MALFALGGTLGAPATAHATPSWLDLYGKVEGGVAIPLRSPQSTYFDPGFGGRLNIGLGLGDFIDIQGTAQLFALPATSKAPSKDGTTTGGFGGGLRLHLPNTFVVSPWVDADVLYVKTGPYDRLGFTVGAGLHIPLGQARMVRLGPFVRYMQVLDTDQPKFDSTDASILMIGLDLEMGLPHRQDRDGDGIVDSEDKCPDQAGPESTGGCPDRDKDGVADKDDRCPDLAGPAETGGCPDRDHDTILDPDDKCPDQAGPKETGGCPDRDHDGIPDNVDKCPDQPGPAATNGCPDKDGDGIPDNVDKCPDQAGPAETGGCPDRDKDGVIDSQDQCPDQPGPAATNGCPDKDGDGVADKDDKCPDQPGPKEREGCPAPQVIIRESKLEVLEKIYFDTNEATILPKSFAVLDNVVTVLKDHADIKLRIEGHTDDRAGKTVNQKLSQRRAEAVKKYLVDHGVDEKRLDAKGYGFSKPIASNKTEEGREKNRRVEFVIVK